MFKYHIVGQDSGVDHGVIEANCYSESYSKFLNYTDTTHDDWNEDFDINLLTHIGTCKVCGYEKYESSVGEIVCDCRYM